MLRRRSPSAFSSTSKTSPKSLTIPVNIALLACIIELAIGPHRLAADLLEHLSQRLHGAGCKRIDPIRADDLWRMKQHRFIDKIGCYESGGKRRAALDHQPGDALRGQKFEPVFEVEAADALRRPQHLDAERQQGELAVLRSGKAGERPDRRLAGALNQARVNGQPQHAVGHDAYRRILGHAGQAARQHRIVRQHGADADHDGIAVRAEKMNALAYRLTRDRYRLSPRRAGFAVGGDRQLEHDVGPAVAHAPDMAGMVAPGFLGTDTDVDR